jgi:hypothetical protein
VLAWLLSWIVFEHAAMPLSDRASLGALMAVLAFMNAGCEASSPRQAAHEGPGPIRVTGGLLARIGVYSRSTYLWYDFYQHRAPGHYITSQALWFWCYFAGAILFSIAAAKVIEIPVLWFRNRVSPPSSKSSVNSNSRPSMEELAKAQPADFEPIPVTAMDGVTWEDQTGLTTAATVIDLGKPLIASTPQVIRTDDFAPPVTVKPGDGGV